MSEDNWPKHPDGTNMTVGEMSDEDRRRVLREAAERYEVKRRANPIAQKMMQEYIDKIKKL